MYIKIYGQKKEKFSENTENKAEIRDDTVAEITEKPDQITDVNLDEIKENSKEENEITKSAKSQMDIIQFNPIIFSDLRT